MTLPSSRTYAGWLALVRILTGVIWLIHAIPKFLNGDAFLPPNGMFSAVPSKGIGTTAGPFHDFLGASLRRTRRSLPNSCGSASSSWGSRSCLGLFSRLGGFFGVLFRSSIWRRGAPGHGQRLGIAGCVLALLSVISLILPTGRIAGFDGLRTPRAPRRPTVVAEVVPERPLDRPTAPPP